MDKVDENRIMLPRDKNEVFIKTDPGNYFNMKYVSIVKHNSTSTDDCFYVSQILDYANIGVVCKNNNPENYKMLKDNIGLR
jgi:hypothetical protein